MIDVSVVIPTYNRLDTLQYVIPSLLANELGNARMEVIVADSCSTDGTAAYLAGVMERHRNVRHLPGDYSGRAMARNAGIAAALGSIVLFTDADIIASPDLVVQHLAHHGGGARVAVVGMEVQVDSYEEYERKRANPSLRRQLHGERPKSLSWLYFLTGNASARRADLERVGKFDESFTGYGHEDLELGYRLQHAGVRLAYEPRAVNYHWHPVPYEEQKKKMELAGRSTVRFYRKHASPDVWLRLGMTPVSLALHSLASRSPALLSRLNDAGERRAGLARNVVYQYHYISGIKAALGTTDA